MTLTYRDLAERGVRNGTIPRVFDYAVPQQWVDDVHRLTGVWPQTLGFVWGYPDHGPGHFWGKPCPLTKEAGELLARYDALKREEVQASV